MSDKDTDKSAAEAPAKKGKKKLIIIVVAAVVLLGGGAGAYVAFFSGPTKKPAPVEGKVVVMDAITVNLADGHFLKLKLALQATAAAAEIPDGSHAADIAITQFSNMSVAELSSTEAREKAKKELTKKVEKAYKDLIMDVYFTEFVMQ
ncbi:MAG: flagellar protein FliL [Micromonosporaceae bacterium]|jgi:flagellar FliL protein|nr:flagellar protein FliL [Micromonosporaceae bacterium]MDT5037453.1 flagellar protein FliL [Micromonosporaceae bacterium]